MKKGYYLTWPRSHEPKQTNQDKRQLSYGWFFKKNNTKISFFIFKKEILIRQGRTKLMFQSLLCHFYPIFPPTTTVNHGWWRMYQRRDQFLKAHVFNINFYLFKVFLGKLLVTWELAFLHLISKHLPQVIKFFVVRLSHFPGTSRQLAKLKHGRKDKSTCPTRSSNSPPKYTLKRPESRTSDRYSYIRVHGSVLHGGQKVKPTQVPINRWIGEKLFFGGKIS